MEVFDLTNLGAPSDQEEPNSTFSAKEVKANPTWTQITVVRVRNDFKGMSFNSFGDFMSSVGSSLRATPQSESITSGPSQIPVEDTSSQARNSSTSRLTSSIALPLPKNLTWNSSNDWSEDETSFMEQFIGNIDLDDFSVSDSISGGLGTAKNRIANLAARTSFRKRAQDQGFAHNPYKEMFYGGVRFRTFQFSWELAPRSEQQAQTIERLLYHLELASHPELIGDSRLDAFWIPDSFEVDFKGTNLPKLQRLVLTNMSTDYTQYGPKFIGNGYPAFIGLDLSFMEIEIRTKRDVQESYSGRNVQGLFGGN